MNKRKSCITYLYQDSLARRMRDLGVSRSELANMTGLSPATILTACNGRPVSVRTIAKVLEYLQVDTSEEDDYWGIDPVQEVIMNTEKDDRIIIEHLHVQQIHRTAKIDLWFNRILGLLSFITLTVMIIYFVIMLKVL